MSRSPASQPAPRGRALALLLFALFVVGSCAPATPAFDRGRLVGELRGPLADWTRYWRRYDPAFTLDSLRWTLADSIHVERIETLADSERTATASRGYAWSPDRTRAVDPNTYREWDPDERRFLYEPDAQAELYDFIEHVGRVLEFCGTPCRYDDAVWLDRERFALMGWEEDLEAPQPGPERFSPRVTVYDLARHTTAFGLGRAVKMQQPD